MPPTVVVSTVGSTTANAFVSRAAFLAAIDERLDAATIPVSDVVAVDRAIIAATRRLAQESFAGALPLATQALPFPRYDVPIADVGASAYFGAYGAYYDATTIPAPIVRATVALAAAILAGTFVFASDAALVQDSALDLDGVRVVLANDPHALPPEVERELRGFRCSTGGAGASTSSVSRLERR